MKPKQIRIISSLLLLLTAMIWGGAFVAQSIGVAHVGPWTFVFSRYAISSLILLPVSRMVDRRIEKKEGRKDPLRLSILGGLCCGFCLGSASISQQIGIQYTTAGKAGFITALYVVIVPVLGLFLGRKPSAKIWLCVGLGLAGLYLISVKEGFSIGQGDILMILCAVLFSFQIMSVDTFSARLRNGVRLSNIQFMVVMLMGLTGMLLFEHPTMEAVRAAAGPILYAGVLSGAVGYTLQIVAQKYTDPTVASLLMSLESVFSVLAGWLILHQGLNHREIMGCALVFAAVLLSEIPIEQMLSKRKGV